MIINTLEIFQKNTFRDSRLADRGNIFINTLTQSGSSVINRMFTHWKDKQAAYRFLDNSKVTKAKIKKEMKNNCLKNIQSSDEHILIIQDTSEINYKASKKRIKKSTKNPRQVNNDYPGFFLHTSIAVGADSNTLYGIPEVQTFNWDANRPRRKNDDFINITKPFKERDSYRWVSTAWHTCNAISPTNPVTVICDREADMYDLLSMKLKPNANLLIRSSHDRIVSDDSGTKFKLKEKMEKSSLVGTYEFDLESRGHGQKKRKVKMEIRYEKITISRPRPTKDAIIDKSTPEKIDLYCVYAKEISVPPKGEEAIEWRLLTTHEVTTFEMARLCVEWYRKRWFIEEVYRVIKSQGFNIEEAQLERLGSLEKLAYLTLIAAIRIVSLKMAFDVKDEEVEAMRDFTKEEICVLQKNILPKLEGKTKIQKNPYKRNSLLWAAWIIARLGGWTGYISQSKPGYITFKRGLDVFYNVMAFI